MKLQIGFAVKFKKAKFPSKKKLIGKQIIWVVNFPIKQIWPFMSEFLITWFIQDDSSVVLAVPDKKINNWCNDYSFISIVKK